MTTQKNRWQTYSAALQNELCTLRDAIEVIAEHHNRVHALKLNFDNHAADEQISEEVKLNCAVKSALKLARGENEIY